MTCKGSHKQPRKLPYGATRGRFWCRSCDADLVPEWNDKPIKKQARQKSKKQTRQKSKKQIRKELKDIGK
jgi:hypothetical protein